MWTVRVAVVRLERGIRAIRELSGVRGVCQSRCGGLDSDVVVQVQRFSTLSRVSRWGSAGTRTWTEARSIGDAGIRTGRTQPVSPNGIILASATTAAVAVAACWISASLASTATMPASPLHMHCDSASSPTSVSGLDALAKGLTSEETKPAERVAILQDLNAVCIHIDNHAQLLRAGLVPILLDRLLSLSKSQTDEEQDASTLQKESDLTAEVLASLAVTPDAVPVYLEAGAVELLLRLLSESIAAFTSSMSSSAVSWLQPWKWKRDSTNAGSSESTSADAAGVVPLNTPATQQYVRCIAFLLRSGRGAPEHVLAHSESTAAPSVLCSLLQHTADAETRRYAMLAVALLCPLQADSVIQCGGLRRMIELISSAQFQTDDVLQWYVTGGLHQLSKDAAIYKALLKHKVVPALCNFLGISSAGAPNPQAETYAVRALRNLLIADSPEGAALRKSAASEYAGAALCNVLNGTERNPGLLRATCVSIQEVAAFLQTKMDGKADKRIATTTTERNSATQILTSMVVGAGDSGGAISRLLALASSRDIAPRVHTAALLAMRELCLAAQGGAVQGMDAVLRVNNSAAIRVLVQDAQSKDATIALAAMECGAALTEWGPVAEVSGDLITLLCSAAGAVSGTAATRALVSIFAHCSRYETPRRLIGYEGGLAKLVQILNEPSFQSDTVIFRDGLRALYNLSTSPLFKLMVAQRGGLELFARGAHSADPLTRKYAHCALAALLDRPEYIARVAELNVAPPLAHAVLSAGSATKTKSDDKGSADAAGIAHCSLLALAQLTNMPDQLSTLALSGAPAAFSSALASAVAKGNAPQYELEYILVALCNLSSTEAGRKALGRTNIKKDLMTVTTSFLYAGMIQNMAATVLENLTSNAAIVAPVIPQQPFPVL
ncbi:hypothetical protein FVE85_2453 [Porphyridium purpureum]|uniref:Protein aardvark n=1 Tax=Porphyridium purpureum TaxID=35688 RepID=A0A5J4YJN2_PORPP|nr:hypothetical protein FVE85_2453 [Porphyridium purpureum]|eukprot:POR7789..scf291_13